jgi:hypothetical protein
MAELFPNSEYEAAHNLGHEAGLMYSPRYLDGINANQGSHNGHLHL